MINIYKIMEGHLNAIRIIFNISFQCASNCFRVSKLFMFLKQTNSFIFCLEVTWKTNESYFTEKRNVLRIKQPDLDIQLNIKTKSRKTSTNTSNCDFRKFSNNYTCILGSCRKHPKHLRQFIFHRNSRMADFF